MFQMDDCGEEAVLHHSITPCLFCWSAGLLVLFLFLSSCQVRTRDTSYFLLSRLWLPAFRLLQPPWGTILQPMDSIKPHAQ